MHASPILFATACPASLLFNITNENRVDNIFCNEIHPSFNPLGVAASSCRVSIVPLRRRGVLPGPQSPLSRQFDFSQCTFSAGATSHVVLVRIGRRIPVVGGFPGLEGADYPLYIAERDTSNVTLQVLHTHTCTIHTCMHAHMCPVVYGAHKYDLLTSNFSFQCQTYERAYLSHNSTQLQSDLNDALSFTVDDLEVAVPVHSVLTISDVEYVFRFTAPASVPIRELETNLSMIQREGIFHFFHIAQVSGEHLYHAVVVDICVCTHVKLCARIDVLYIYSVSTLALDCTVVVRSVCAGGSVVPLTVHERTSVLKQYVMLEHSPFMCTHTPLHCIISSFLCDIICLCVLPLTDTCDCPNDFSTTLGMSFLTHRFCRAPSYVPAVCRCPEGEPFCSFTVRDEHAFSWFASPFN